MQEQIKLKTSRTGTTVTFFDTMLQAGEDSLPAVVLYDNIGNPARISTFQYEPYLQSAFTHEYSHASEFGQTWITGGTRSQTFDFVLTSAQRTNVENNWRQSMGLLFSGLSTQHVFFEDKLIDDMFVDINLNRSYETLDTLNIYNNLINSVPIQESDTGTVFGRLMANQKRIRDAEGNVIKIPLRNVPIGIFTSTEEFPTPSSVDGFGNRMSPNIKESASLGQYFNIQSFSADSNNYLQSGSEFTAVPQHYQYVTTTNDEGEFVIHNVPVGVASVFFEVDLFKQGLTKDEIALNRFPFPGDDLPNVDSLPSMFFRYFDVDVVPTWGNIQTGYTELNINVELDLRKWATYFINHISFNGLNFEEIQRKGYFTPLTVEVRDMSEDDYPIRKIQIVEVPNLIARDEEHVLVWENEFPQIKNKAEFYFEGYRAFKLPANMYDPVGFKTNMQGIPTGMKGIWLAGYQLKMYYTDKEQVFRSTGSHRIQLDNNVITRDHFHLNRNNNNYTVSNFSALPVLGDFPYEKKWDHTYPEPYRIPEVPIQPNPNYDDVNDSGKRIAESPKWLDGDLVGTPFADFREDDGLYGGTGGYGVIYDDNKNEWFKGDFSKFVSKNYIYKYEQDVSSQEKYANGYRPLDSDFPNQPLVSSVKNGEKYQRVECGYAYWLRPEGWPRVVNYPFGGDSDAVYDQDTRNPNTTVEIGTTNDLNAPLHTAEPYTNSVNLISTNSGRKIYLNMGSDTTIPEGGLDIYRVVDPSPANLNIPDPSVTPSFVRLNFMDLYMQRGSANNRLHVGMLNGGPGGTSFLFWKNGVGSSDSTIGALRLEIRNKGVIPVEIAGRRLLPNQSASFADGELNNGAHFYNMMLDLPGNSAFDYDNTIYTKARYQLTWKNITLYRFNGNAAGTENFERAIDFFNLDTGPSNDVPNYYLRSYLTNVVTTYHSGSNGVLGIGSVSSGCKNYWVYNNKGIHTVIVNGMTLVNPSTKRGGWWGSRFLPYTISPTCSSTSVSGPANVIPFQLDN